MDSKRLERLLSFEFVSFDGGDFARLQKVGADTVAVGQSTEPESTEVEVTAVYLGGFQRYDSSYLKYAFKLDGVEYGFAWETDFDETHRGLAAGAPRVWYDQVEQGDELRVKVSRARPEDHTILGSSFAAMNGRAVFLGSRPDKGPFRLSKRRRARLDSEQEYHQRLGRVRELVGQGDLTAALIEARAAYRQGAKLGELGGTVWLVYCSNELGLYGETIAAVEPFWEADEIAPGDRSSYDRDAILNNTLNAYLATPGRLGRAISLLEKIGLGGAEGWSKKVHVMSSNPAELGCVTGTVLTLARGGRSDDARAVLSCFFETLNLLLGYERRRGPISGERGRYLREFVDNLSDDPILTTVVDELLLLEAQEFLET